jgi:trehalose 6-phosphate synthase/phosphatase
VKMFVRFAIPLTMLLGLITALAVPVADSLLTRWFRHDVEVRSRLIASSIGNSLVSLIRMKSDKKISLLFNDIARDERVLGVAWCMAAGEPSAASNEWPRLASCPPETTGDAPSMRIHPLLKGTVLEAQFPLSDGTTRLGRLVILHDLSFIDRRSDAIIPFLAGFLILLTIGASAVTILVARFTLKSWVTSAVSNLRRGGTGDQSGEAPELSPLVDELRKSLNEIEAAGGSNAIRIDWSPETLRRLLDVELPGEKVIIVSNREPYIHNDKGGQVVVQRPASGVVTALEPIMRACGGVWIAHGSGTADRQTVDANGYVKVPPDDPSYTLRRIWLDEAEEDGYYYGFSNEGLWPLCHVCFVRPHFREADWLQYVAVNQKFADAIIEEAVSPDPIVLVQDYHLALVPQMVRDKLPAATIVTFWHIPWPNSEVISICPWRVQLLEGLLGSSIIGFHTPFFCNNFISTVDRFIESQIDRDHAVVTVAGHATRIRAYPISVPWPAAAEVGEQSVTEARLAVRSRFGLAPDTVVGIGVERLDFTKGIVDRFRAIEALLENEPHWIGRFVFIQIAAPSRSKLESYQKIQRETVAVAEEINARFGSDGYQPILLILRHHEPTEVTELFRAAELCVVSSLHDGMNLVAKEFVAARRDEAGVLVLSMFAGAARELTEALLVNPYDTLGMAQALSKALLMPPSEVSERMRLMRTAVREKNVFHWAGQMLLDAARARRQSRVRRQAGKILPGEVPQGAEGRQAASAKQRDGGAGRDRTNVVKA